MKVVFVCSGNSSTGINSLVKSQGESLKKGLDKLDYFPINGKGLNNYIKHVCLLRQHLKNSSYDLIHAHYGLCGIVSRLAAMKKKIVVSFMGDDLIGAVNSKGRYSLFGDLLANLNRLFLNSYDFTITKSQQLSSRINLKSKNAVIPNGVDLTVFYEIDKLIARGNLKFPSNKKLIIFVSNPEREEKNYRLAEDAVKKINKENIELMAVHSMGLDRLKHYYNAADLLILTSYHEGSPNVIKEAMVCNCPIVSTDVGDVRWVIGDTEGCYITSYEPEDIAKKIKLALDFSQKVGRTKGRDRIIELGLDSETIAKKIIAIYKKVLSSH